MISFRCLNYSISTLTCQDVILKTTYKIDVLVFRTLDTITETDENNNDDYLSIMHNNISLLQKEHYK